MIWAMEHSSIFSLSKMLLKILDWCRWLSFYFQTFLMCFTLALSMLLCTRFISRHLEMFYKNYVPKHFAKLPEKKACVGISILRRFQASITKAPETLRQALFSIFYEIFKNSWFVEHLWTAASVGVSLWVSNQEVFLKSLLKCMQIPVVTFTSK